MPEAPVEVAEVAEEARQRPHAVVAEPEEMEARHPADGIGQALEPVEDEYEALEALETRDRVGQFGQQVVAEVEEAETGKLADHRWKLAKPGTMEKLCKQL